MVDEYIICIDELFFKDISLFWLLYFMESMDCH